VAASVRPNALSHWILSTAVASIGAVFMATGCSVAFVQGPPPAAERRPGFECTTSRAAPIVDLSVSVLSLLLATGAVSNPNSSFGKDPGLRAVTVGSGILVAGGTLMSAVLGLDRISDCELAQAATEPSLRVERRAPVAAAPEDAPPQAASSPLGRPPR